MPECPTCKNSRYNNGGKWCMYAPCGNDWKHYESIYTIEPTIVLATRFYTPQTNDEQITIAPMVLSIEEEE